MMPEVVAAFLLMGVTALGVLTFNAFLTRRKRIAELERQTELAKYAVDRLEEDRKHDTKRFHKLSSELYNLHAAIGEFLNDEELSRFTEILAQMSSQDVRNLKDNIRCSRRN